MMMAIAKVSESHHLAEPRLARALRAALNANGEFGSGIGALFMSAATILMLEPDISPFVLLKLPDRGQAFFDTLAFMFLCVGLWQLWAVLNDRRALRVQSAWLSSIVWACSVSAFTHIHFYGSVSLCLAMIVTNVFAAARGRLQIEEWERLGCARAMTCQLREPPCAEHHHDG